MATNLAGAWCGTLDTSGGHFHGRVPGSLVTCYIGHSGVNVFRTLPSQSLETWAWKSKNQNTNQKSDRSQRFPKYLKNHPDSVKPRIYSYTSSQISAMVQVALGAAHFWGLCTFTAHQLGNLRASWIFRLHRCFSLVELANRAWPCNNPCFPCFYW